MLLKIRNVWNKILENIKAYFYVLLTVHLNIILVIDQLNAHILVL